MKARSWIRNLFTGKRPGPFNRPIRKKPLRARLALEALEDRCVPSTLKVTSSADDVTVNHTLRYAVAHAQSGDTILLTEAITAPIVLTHGELVLSQSVTIKSVPTQTPTISGNGMSRIFEISAGASVVLDNLNLIDGNSRADNPNGTFFDDALGGAILNLGTLTVKGSTLSGNTANPFGKAALPCLLRAHIQWRADQLGKIREQRLVGELETWPAGKNSAHSVGTRAGCIALPSVRKVHAWHPAAMTTL